MDGRSRTLITLTGKHFLNVQRKGDNATPKVYIPNETREAIDRTLSLA